MKTVLCSGVFDLLHVAHVRHLEQAAGMGILIVGVTVDHHVNKGYGRPVIPQEERVEMVRALRCVNVAVLVNDSMQALKHVVPDIYCKGHDYLDKGLLPEEITFCADHGIEIRHTTHNHQSTSKIIERIKCTSS